MQTGSNLVEVPRIGSVFNVLKNVRGGMQEDRRGAIFKPLCIFEFLMQITCIICQSVPEKIIHT